MSFFFHLQTWKGQVPAICSVSTELYMNPPTPGSPFGSKLSESSIPVAFSSHRMHHSISLVAFDDLVFVH
ncbi:hypothetical protein JHK82_054210 [Glycine max]|uniref:Uncharacterized protein n=2 Tax=Glycine subgen. Soja TaxID=1462606 RepID=A0A0R0EZD1_SOYBN|nr:hypothetical protein JHK86_054055 [Glycine max]KAG4916558.1 hypothetical protein JHK87_054115 [Glycine soja]KAG4928528.1 hypothetical protein JHK85_055014 [Glycine max]KAG5084044.1 hypothetical protein JHK84_054082 [Glycine max]KAG5086813.1 hypothetical protein JHK82_054210 [Glycine max]